MPIHFNDLDVVSEVAGLSSALIVPCKMCPAVRDVVKSDDCKVIEGMEATGIMNAELRFHLTGNVSFENCKTVPISQ